MQQVGMVDILPGYFRLIFAYADVLHPFDYIRYVSETELLFERLRLISLLGAEKSHCRST